MLAFSHYDKIPETNCLKIKKGLFWLKFVPWSVGYVFFRVYSKATHDGWECIIGQIAHFILTRKKNKGSKDSNILHEAHPNSPTFFIELHLLKAPSSPSATIRWGHVFILVFGSHLRPKPEENKKYYGS